MNAYISKNIAITVIFSFTTLSCGGLKIKPRKDSELVDSVFTSSKALYYIEGCENSEVCGNNRVEQRVDRVLVCENLHPSIAPLFKRPYKIEIEAEESFTIKSVVDFSCWGLELSLIHI